MGNGSERLQRHLKQLFAQTDKKFWEDGIMEAARKNYRR